MKPAPTIGPATREAARMMEAEIRALRAALELATAQRCEAEAQRDEARAALRKAYIHIARAQIQPGYAALDQRAHMHLLRARATIVLALGPERDEPPPFDPLPTLTRQVME